MSKTAAMGQDLLQDACDAAGLLLTKIMVPGSGAQAGMLASHFIHPETSLTPSANNFTMLGAAGLDSAFAQLGALRLAARQKAAADKAERLSGIKARVEALPSEMKQEDRLAFAELLESQVGGLPALLGGGGSSGFFK